MFCWSLHRPVKQLKSEMSTREQFIWTPFPSTSLSISFLWMRVLVIVGPPSGPKPGHFVGRKLSASNFLSVAKGRVLPCVQIQGSHYTGFLCCLLCLCRACYTVILWKGHSTPSPSTLSSKDSLPAIQPTASHYRTQSLLWTTVAFISTLTS